MSGQVQWESDSGLLPSQAERHAGRGFVGHEIEDACPCQQEPCGLVRIDDANPACKHHPPERVQTMRQGHRPEDCPDAATAREAAGRRLHDAETADNADEPHWRLIPREDRETWIRRSKEANR